MRRSVVLFFFAALTESVLAQQPTCRTFLDLPCYTIRMSHRQWQIFMNGSAEIVMFTDASIAALRSDGSRVVVGDSSSWQLLGIRSNHKGSWLYLAPENEIVTVDDTKQTIARREPLIWHDLPYRRSVPNDSTCRSGILHFGTVTTEGTSRTDSRCPMVPNTRERRLRRGISSAITGLYSSEDVLNSKKRTMVANVH